MFSCQLSSQKPTGRLDDGRTHDYLSAPPTGWDAPWEKECAEICGMHLEEARPLRDAMKIAFIYDTCITQTYIYIHSIYIYIYRYKQQEWIDS